MPIAAISAESADASADNSDVKPGYVGVAKFGAWRLICTATGSAAPQDAGVAGTAVDPAPKTAVNVCRVNQEIPAAGKKDQILVAANFGVLGPMRRPALMLRLPPTVHAGDIITMRVDDAHTLRTPVRDCGEKECLAAASLSDDDWNDLTAAGTVEIAFPIADKQRILVDLPMNGIQDAVDAMTTAQSVPDAAPAAAPAPAAPANAAPAQKAPPPTAP
jgi:invasion protein IalB